MADLSGSSLVGRTISHYRIVSPLGTGGMGVVYRAEDVRLGRPVAIKFIADDLANDAQAVARLRAEARAASSLNHPNICTIHDIGEDEGHPFIVMELMEGQTLRERLIRGRLKVHELVDLGIQTADALQGAHGAGIVHRDIKPANIFLTGRGQVKLLDFGLAKLTTVAPGSDSETLATAEHTAAGTTLGTVSYMSPEQASGEELDGRTDLFSLGVVLYECATGKPPFEGKTHAVILSAILNRAPTPPGLLNPELPARLQDVITTCLEKDRELRYQSAADLRADLKRIRRDLESGRAAVDVSASSASPSVGPASRSVRSTTRSSTESRAPADTTPATRVPRLAMGAVALVALLGAGAYALWPRVRPEPPATADAGAQPRADVQSRLSLAQSSLDAGNFRAAQSYANEVLALDPNQATAAGIQRDAAAALARFDEAVGTARQRLAANDVQGAAQALTRARDIDPTAPAVSELGAALAERVRTIEPVSPSRDGRPAGANRQVSPPVTQAAPPSRRGADQPIAATPPPATPPVSTSAPPPPPQVVEPPPGPVAPPPGPVAPPPAPNTAPTAPPAPGPPPTARSGNATPSAPETTESRGTGAAGPPSTTATERPGPSADDAAIRRIVADYGRAIETKDVALFRTLKPNITPEEERRLREGFRTVTSQRVNLSVLSVDLRGQDASVAVARRDTVNAGGRQQTVESRQTFRLKRAGSGWVIDEIR